MAPTDSEVLMGCSCELLDSEDGSVGGGGGGGPDSMGRGIPRTEDDRPGSMGRGILLTEEVSIGDSWLGGC